MRGTRLLVAVGTSLILLVTGPIISAANAGMAGAVTWKGNGTTIIDDDRVPTTMECFEDEPDYLLFQLTSTKGVSVPEISFDGGATKQPMTVKTPPLNSGVYVAQYTSDDPIDVGALLESADVAVTFTGSGRPTLTVARGCVHEPEPVVGVARPRGPYPVDGLVGIFCGGYPATSYAVFCAAALTIIEPLFAGEDENGNRLYGQGSYWWVGQEDPANPANLIAPDFADLTKLGPATFHDDGDGMSTPAAPLYLVPRMDIYTSPGVACDEGDYFTIVYEGVSHRFDLDCDAPPAP